MKNGDKYIGWRQFSFIISGVIGFSIMIGTFLFNMYLGLANKVDDLSVEVAADMSIIKTDVKWIKEIFEEPKDMSEAALYPFEYDSTIAP